MKFQFFKKKFKEKNRWGRKGENIAEEYLQKLGCQILERNYVNKKGYRIGEIDIIVRDKDTLVFVEVKTRKYLGKQDLPPEMAVDKRKISRLTRIAHQYLQERHLLESLHRFDVISIVYKDEQDFNIKHLKNIFL